MKPSLPALDSEARQPCKRLRVDENLEIAIEQHRAALAKCESRRGLAVQHIDLIEAGFGQAPKEK